MDEQHDAIWKALADPTRREILDLLRAGPQSTTSLVESFSRLSRFGVMKHLDVLKACGLVIATKDGRRVSNRLNAVPLRMIYDRWVSRFEDLWAGTLIGIKSEAESIE